MGDKIIFFLENILASCFTFIQIIVPIGSTHLEYTFEFGLKYELKYTQIICQKYSNSKIYEFIQGDTD